MMWQRDDAMTGRHFDTSRCDEMRRHINKSLHLVVSKRRRIVAIESPVFQPKLFFY